MEVGGRERERERERETTSRVVVGVDWEPNLPARVCIRMWSYLPPLFPGPSQGGAPVFPVSSRGSPRHVGRQVPGTTVSLLPSVVAHYSGTIVILSVSLSLCLSVSLSLGRTIDCRAI